MTDMTPKIRVYLSFRGFSNDVSAIGDLLNIEPSIFLGKGELTKAGRVSKTSFWSATLFTGDTWALSDALEIVLADEKLSKLSSVREKIDGEGWLGVTVTCDKPPSINIASETLVRLGKLGISVDIDLFADWAFA